MIALGVSDRKLWLSRQLSDEAASCYSDVLWKTGVVPEERSTAVGAKVAFLIVSLGGVMKRVDIRFALLA